ncbi:MAG: LutB/LldF family L-lactate oxidation iron-sulfur protein [Bacteroidota bacterium]
MHDLHTKFKDEAEKIAFDEIHRNKIKFNIGRYDAAVEKGKAQFCDMDLAKDRAGSIKFKVVNELDKYLTEFEMNFSARGGKVIWAKDGEEAVSEVLDILKRNEVKMVVKSKSMTTEEIELNENLEKNHIESVETDLGEYIVQLAGEKPYHIVTPAMHKSKENVAELFNEKFGLPINSTPEEITYFVRKKLKDKFLTADAGITGANFLIADVGAIALTENEGNGFLSMSLPKIHIVIVGIEKIIPSINDLHLFWPLLAQHGTGQKLTVYNSVVLGPRQESEVDGPEEMYVILLDNNRTELLAKKEQRRALSCIRCGACLNVCPIYKNIGGYTYDTTYSGPIGAVITPHLKGFEKYKHLSFASTLCGKCTEVCPVRINLHELLLENRNESVKLKLYDTSEKMVMFAWKKLMLHRKLIDFSSAKIKNIFLGKFFQKQWGSRRDLPKINEQSFHDWWKKERGV